MSFIRDKFISRTVSSGKSLQPSNDENVYNPNNDSSLMNIPNPHTNSVRDYGTATTVMSPPRGLVMHNKYVRKPLTKKPVSRTQKGRASVTSYSVALRPNSNVTIKVKVSSLLGTESRHPFEPATESVLQTHVEGIPKPPEANRTPKTYQEALAQINPEVKYLQTQPASPSTQKTKGRYRDLSEIVQTIQKNNDEETKVPGLYRSVFEKESKEEKRDIAKSWQDESSLSFPPPPITPLSTSFSLDESILSPRIARFVAPEIPALRPRKEESSPYSKYFHERHDTLDREEPELFVSSVVPKGRGLKLGSQSEKIRLDDHKLFFPVQQREKDKLELLERQRKELREIRRKERENTVLEIRDYEKSYCEQLDIIIEKFWHPLVLSNLISIEKIRSIFSIASELFTYSSILSVKIDSVVNEWERRQAPLLMGDILLKGFSSLSCYSIFINNYNDAIKILTEERKTNIPFARFLQVVEEDPVVEFKQLEDFIIAPVQYLPKHEVLLSKLLRLTDKSDADKEPLTAALLKLKRLITSVNESKRQSELMKECQAKISKYNIYSTGRKFIRDGECECTKAGKQTGKNKHNQLFLFSDLLLVTKKKKSDPSQFKVVYDLPLDSISVVNKTSVNITVKDREKLSKIPHDENTLIVKNNKNYYYLLTFPSSAKKSEWESELNKALTPSKKHWGWE
eukprot:TRINITY_DN6479_c0_g2_i1.p1 TRINITY_DN6479_c0_g2~~TRINITY_DN6479_c0_g2_i1.p1  ORF type:complete len:684 (-),score=127.89 TRINITY_DN6479_c0_g2_i1:148-2199(-)